MHMQIAIVMHEINCGAKNVFAIDLDEGMNEGRG